MNSNISEITVRIDAETLKSATGMTMDELAVEEANLDMALSAAVAEAFPNVEKVQGVAFYVSEPTVEAYDTDGNPASIPVDYSAIVKSAVAKL